MLDGILDQANDYLTDDGKLLLAYGAKTAIERIVSQTSTSDWRVQIADERQISDLPEVFVPGVLLILTRETLKTQQ